RELALFRLDERMASFQAPGAGQRFALGGLVGAMPPFRPFVDFLGRTRQVPGGVAALGHAAVADAAAEQSEILVRLFEQHAAMLVAPVPGEYPLAAQDLAESRMAEQLRALFLEMRVELMVRKKHHLAVV